MTDALFKVNEGLSIFSQISVAVPLCQKEVIEISEDDNGAWEILSYLIFDPNAVLGSQNQNALLKYYEKPFIVNNTNLEEKVVQNFALKEQGGGGGGAHSEIQATHKRISHTSVGRT